MIKLEKKINKINNIIEFKKINYNHFDTIIKKNSKSIFFMLIFFIIVYMTIDNSKINLFYSTFLFYIVYELFILIKSYYKSFIFIYKIQIENNNLKLFWQNNNSIKECECKLNNVKLEYVDNNSTKPYLRIQLYKENEQNIIIKQREYGNWSIKVMKEVIETVGRHGNVVN